MEIKKILLLENSDEDAHKILDILTSSDLHPEVNVVPDRTAFLDGLKTLQPDIILSDIDLTGFDGFDALSIVKRSFSDIPFIFVAGTVGEEMAVKACKSGATDFILKTNLSRLVPAVKKAINEGIILTERKNLHQTLKESEARYRTLVENLPVGVFRTSIGPPAILLQANQATATMHGFSSINQMINFHVRNLYYNPEERKEFTEQIIKQGKVKDRLIRMIKTNGEPFWASITASCHFGHDGKPEWIDGTIEDVTEKREIEDKLNIYSKFFETLVNTIDNPVFYKNTEFRFQGCNKVFSNLLFGLPPEKIINKTLYDFKGALPHDLIEMMNRKDSELLSNPGTQKYESIIKCSDGKTRHFHTSKSTYYSPDGKVAGLVGIMTDITDRVASENELRRINEEFNLLINSINSLIIGVSTKDRIFHWNPYAEEILGIKSENVKNTNFSLSGINWDWQKIYEAIALCMVETRTVKLDDVRFMHTNGKEGVLGLTVNPLVRGGVILEGFIILGNDLTEQKILEEQLLQSRKLEAIGQLAAGVAHEINTPMQYVGDNIQFIKKSITGLLEMLSLYDSTLKKRSGDNSISRELEQADNLSRKIKLPFVIEELPKALDQSLEGIERISRIVQSMKAFSHPGTGQKIPTNINKSIENTVTVTRNEWKYDCELRLDLDPGLPQVPCIESEFNQVMLNLIINAVDAIRDSNRDSGTAGGLIKIKTSGDGDNAVIEIEDNGTGIPENIKDRIFDPFFTTKEVGKGTGQGLAISHSIIVEKHGGSLFFKSEEGKGTIFIIKLPINEEQLQL